MIIGEKDRKQKRLEDMAGWHLIEEMDAKELGKVRTDIEFRGHERLQWGDDGHPAILDNRAEIVTR